MSVTAAQAIANYQSNPNIAPQVVVDSAANINAYLDGLEPLASASNIVSITLTDTGTPIFTITTTQLVNDAQALELIATPFAITAIGLSTLVTFNGANGAEPFGSLIADAQGDLFGTTAGRTLRRTCRAATARCSRSPRPPAATPARPLPWSVSTAPMVPSRMAMKAAVGH